MNAIGRRPSALVALRALGLGDLLVAVPALRGLARAFPDHARLLLAPRALAPLLALVRGGWRLSPLEGKSALDPAAPLPLAGPVDVAVNLHGRGPQSHALLRRLEPARLLAFAPPDAAPGEARHLPVWRPGEPERMRWCRLLRACGVPADPDDLDLAAPGLPAPELRGVTVLHVGAGSPARRWPLEHWAAVADHERRCGGRVVLTGGRTERRDAMAIAHCAGLAERQVLAGRTGLRQLIAVVGTAERVVSTDTGMAHLATALRTPSVVLFGPGSPRQWGPPKERWWHVPLWTGVRGRAQAELPHPGLLAITPEDVLAALAVLPPRSEVPTARR